MKSKNATSIQDRTKSSDWRGGKGIILTRKPLHIGKSASVSSFTLPPIPHIRQPLSPTSLPRSPIALKPVALAPRVEHPSLEDYRILRTIGTGSLSRVRLAVHKDTRDPVAIKIMLKQEVVRKRQIDHVRNERTILSTVSHPFIARLRHTFQDKEHLYMVQEYVAGGELYRLIRAKGKLSLREARFYAAELISVLSYLHNRKIIYRDVKPENLLISPAGHLKLVDFGFAKMVNNGEKTFTLCGTPEYLAPEVIQQRGHDSACDWWGLGVLMFEMTTGHAPFIDPNPFKLYEKIVNSHAVFPSDVDDSVRTLISGLMEKGPIRRFQLRQVRSHEFFAEIDWESLENEQVRPPYIPSLRMPEDSSNFEIYQEEAEIGEKVAITYDMFPNF